MKRPSNFIDIQGRTYGRITVLKYAGNKKWECRCSCGKKWCVGSQFLRNGRTRSCGCLSAELSSLRMTIHGGVGLSEYSSWSNMIQRCLNPKCPCFKHYGGRGIKICKRWMSFKKFLKDMGRKPSAIHSINRKNNNGGYNRSNCVWSTMNVQANNKSTNRQLAFNGKKLNISQWATTLHMTRFALWARLNSERWSIERALTTPVRK